MATGIRRAAADGRPAVLETGDPANVEVYPAPASTSGAP